MKKWRCKVCGYIHEGDEPPETCPVCGAPREEFEPYVEEKGNAEALPRMVADVIVVGSGAAALSAAVTAKSNGSSVIVVEKGERVGGTTARSGGGFWIPGNSLQKAAGHKDSRKDCLRYMARYSYPNKYNPKDPKLGLNDHQYGLIEAFYDNASKMVDRFIELDAFRPVLGIGWNGEPYPDYYDELPENKGIRGRVLFASDKDGNRAMGGELIKSLDRWCRMKGVEFVTGCEVVAVLKDGNRAMGGVVGKTEKGNTRFVARQGVVFGTGGYAHDPELMQQFQPGPVYGGCSVATSTGDFIRIAGGIGAMIGNTHGAFRSDSVFEAHLANPNGINNAFFISGDSSIVVNKYGKRYMNEKKNYNDRGRAHMDWDLQKVEWRNMLTFMLLDERTATYWQGMPPLFRKDKDLPKHIIKADTLEGIADGISERLKAVSQITGGFSLDENFLKNLKETVKTFNGYTKNGKDLDFGRGESAYDREWTTSPPYVPGVEWPPKGSKNITMYPISEEGPYYAAILSSGTLDTNGGPVVDAKARVLDWKGRPIEGLYGAGNCIAAPSAGAYWGAGGTIGPAMAFGYIAGTEISARERKDPDV